MSDHSLRRAAEAWLSSDPDETTREELRAILARDDDAPLRDRFAGHLEFGTAGLRGLLGAGPNRMNRAVVIRTTKGVASHLLDAVPDARARGVVVAGDARRMSREFTGDVAAVFAAAGIAVVLFPTPEATPLLAFAVKHLRAAAGVMITASHNAAPYNGYKLYWETGAQIVPPHDAAVERAILAVSGASAVPRADAATARAGGLLREPPAELLTRYVEGVRALRLHPELSAPLSIVYTPIHGVGLALAERAFHAAGLGPLLPVAEQAAPDPTFPTAPFPNPEEAGVMDLALRLAEREHADLVIANDPDADRLAVAVPHLDGTFVRLTGNQIGVLLGHYLLRESPEKGERVVLSTIVSSPMLGRIAVALGATYEETLTGFKWMESRALELASRGARTLFAYEEALGYAVGELVRDKDGVSAGVLFAELAAFCRARGTTVLAHLEELYRTYGFFASSQKTLAVSDSAEVKGIMDRFRARLPERIDGQRVLSVRDYLAADSRLAPSDVLAVKLASGTRVVIRPSGTEPKMKVYLDYEETIPTGEPLVTAEARAARVLEGVGGAVLRLAETG